MSTGVPTANASATLTANREPEALQNTRPFGSSMQSGSALAAKITGRANLNKHRLSGSLLKFKEI